MKNEREILLAEEIIQLDLLRDELYEELLKTFGCRTHEFLRAVQNRKAMLGPLSKIKADLQSRDTTTSIQC